MTRPEGYDHRLARDAMNDELVLAALHQWFQGVKDKARRGSTKQSTTTVHESEAPQEIPHPQVGEVRPGLLTRLTALSKAIGRLASFRRSGDTGGLDMLANLYAAGDLPPGYYQEVAEPSESPQSPSS